MKIDNDLIFYGVNYTIFYKKLLRLGPILRYVEITQTKWVLTIVI
jgi:hypothetical protein